MSPPSKGQARRAGSALAGCSFLFLVAGVFSLAMAASSPRQEGLEAVVVRVVDVDTVRVRFDSCPGVPAVMEEVSIRFDGCDGPEKRSPSPELRSIQREGMDLMKSLLRPGQRVTLSVRRWDKYGGRLVGTVWVGGLDPCALLIDRGLARPYHGESKVGLW